MQMLINGSGASLPYIGVDNTITANGEVQVDTMVLQCQFFHLGQPFLPQWTNVKACISLTVPGAEMGERLCGIWLRHLLYCLNVPDNTGAMLGTDMSEILANVPLADPVHARLPQMW